MTIENESQAKKRSGEIKEIDYASHFFHEWQSETSHMSHIATSIYIKLRHMYFTDSGEYNGKIDASDFELLCYRLKCFNETEVNELKFVLRDKFKKNGNTYRHSKWDREIKNIRWAMSNSKNGNNDGNTDNDYGNYYSNTGNDYGNDYGNTGNAKTSYERRKKSEEKRKKLIDDLQKAGIVSHENKPMKALKMQELEALHKEHCADIASDETSNNDGNTGNNDGNSGGNTGNNDGNEQGNSSNAEKPSNNKDNNKDNNNIKNKYANEVTEVFEFWKSIFGKTEQTILTDKRKAKIIGRLKDGYTVEQIKQAIYNCSRSDYHVSNNYIDVELICRDVEKIDRFLGLTEQVRNQAKSSHQPFGGVHDPLAVNQVWEQRQATGRSALDDLRDMGINVQEGVTTW